MLTGAKVRAARGTGKRYTLADEKGLELRISAGGKKTWSLVYRFRGARRRVTLGEFPEVSLSDARDLAFEARRAVARGIDPAAEKKAAKLAERDALRMVDLFGETGPLVDGKLPKSDKVPGWYLGEYCPTAGRNDTQKSGTATERYRIIKYLRSDKRLMRRKVSDVTVADLNKIKRKATPGTWRQLRALIRIAFRHAVEVGAIEASRNPAEKTTATGVRKMERYLSSEERKRLDEVLARAERIGPSMKDQPRGTKGGVGRHIVRAIRLLVLTGMRRSQVLSMRWEKIDWGHGHARVTDKVGGGEIAIHLSAATLDYLRREQKAAKVRDGYVCAGPSGRPPDGSHVTRAWRTIRKQAGLDDVRLHDLRHSWASTAISNGVPLAVIGKALGHRSPVTTARYAHLSDDALRAGIEQAAAAIDAATKGTASDG